MTYLRDQTHIFELYSRPFQMIYNLDDHSIFHILLWYFPFARKNHIHHLRFCNLWWDFGETISKLYIYVYINSMLIWALYDFMLYIYLYPCKSYMFYGNVVWRTRRIDTCSFLQDQYIRHLTQYQYRTLLFIQNINTKILIK